MQLLIQQVKVFHNFIQPGHQQFKLHLVLVNVPLINYHFLLKAFSSSIDNPALAEADVSCCLTTNSSTPITSSTLKQEQILEILEKKCTTWL